MHIPTQIIFFKWKSIFKLALSDHWSWHQTLRKLSVMWMLKFRREPLESSAGMGAHGQMFQTCTTRRHILPRAVSHRMLTEPEKSAKSSKRSSWHTLHTTREHVPVIHAEGSHLKPKRSGGRGWVLWIQTWATQQDSAEVGKKRGLCP